jgi:hypothetical protein
MTPALSRILFDWSIPFWPWSTQWLPAIEHALKPACLTPVASSGGVLKIG